MDRRKFIKNGAILCGFGGLCAYCGKDFFNKNYTGETKSGSGVMPCRLPFEYCEIHYGGNVYPCCPAFLKTGSFGNLFEQSFDDIWNGEKFKKLRADILNGDFSMCKIEKCVWCFEKVKPENCKKYDAPKEMLLTYNQECNYRCITCRDKYVYNDKKTNDLYDNVLLPKLMPVLKKLEKISISGGDPLASKHTRNLISRLATENPEIKMSLCTQGYLLNEENLKRLNIKKLDKVRISVNAATRNTYKKIMRIDAFDRIMKNIEFISNMKKKGNVNSVALNFVVHSLNYKEMKDFVKIAEKFDVFADFSVYEPWSSAEMHKRYKEVAVFEPFHKDYGKLCEILQDPIFLGPHCVLMPQFEKIAKSKVDRA